MSRYRKFTTICCAAVFALGLAACGGGGNDGLNTSQEQMLQEQVATLQGQINALREQLGLDPADDLGDSVEELQQQVTDLQKQIDDAAEAERMKAEEAKRMAMMATAMKLHAGISAPMGDGAGASDRFAAYSGTNDSQISVTFGDGTNPGTAIVLSEDKKTTVADNHDWTGKRYADPAGGDMVEAVVYSNVGDPTEGDPFNEEYTLADGALAIDTTAATTPGSRVASPSFNQSAGLKRFKLPSPNPSGATRITVSGSYHGVSGTYTCTPGTGNTCVSRVAANGFDLGVVDASNAFTAGSWIFTPSTPTAKVMSTPDADYASYGWWIHKSADDKTYTASAFVDDKGTVAAAEGITALRGTATYMGGAAGKYALYSATGGTNDAGHFTARATLEADFGDDMITGTIDQFMGADGMARNWSVELMESAIGDTGLIRRSDDDNSDLAATDPGAMTKWTIDGTAGAAGGQWTGALKDNGDDGVPKVATGTFHSTYGQGNSMVGAFGVNKQ